MVRRVLVAALVLGTPVPALAQSAADARIAQARERFDEGQAAYDRSDFSLALEAFTDVFDTLEEAGHPNALLVLYNVALTNQHLGRDAEALAQYERYLREGAPDAPNRDAAARNAADLRRRAAMSAGSGGGGGEAGGGSLSPIGPIIAGVGAASVIAGAALGGVALSENEGTHAGCIGTRCPSDARDGFANADALANSSDALLFGGLAVVATGLVIMFVLADDGTVEASAACAPTGCSAAIRGTF